MNIGNYPENLISKLNLMNIPLTRSQVKSLPLGFTPTGGFNRKERRSKEYQKKIDEYYKEQAIAQANEISLANCIINEQGEVTHNPILTTDEPGILE